MHTRNYIFAHLFIIFQSIKLVKLTKMSNEDIFNFLNFGLLDDVSLFVWWK